MFRPCNSVIFIVLTILVKAIICTKSISETKRTILDNILSKNSNDILVPPRNRSDGATEVQVFLHVKSIDNIDEEKMELTTRLIFRQIWKDPRLRYIDIGYFQNILINDDTLIWTPDIYFANLKNIDTYDVISPTTYLEISPVGSVLYSKYILLTTSCPMNFKRFPFDHQSCEIQISTYGLTTNELQLVWKDTAPVTLLKNVHSGLFSMEKFVTHYRTLTATRGSYTTLVLTFMFQRDLQYYLIHIFIPCIMLVILSWIPSWINKKQIAVRLGLGLSALLTAVILIYDYNKTRPQLSYTTLMDCFTGTSLTFMFFGIIESTIVYILVQKSENNCTENEGLVLKSSKTSSSKLLRLGDKFDFWIGLINPIGYIAFCIIYFALGQSNDINHPSISGNHTTSWLTT